MREILFRGKTLKSDDCCLDDNERGIWVYGTYTDEIGADCIGWYDELDKTWNIREVDPNMICEFTNQYDCEGNRIFEDDVIEINDKIYLVDILDCDNMANAKVIGNIHDNPELWDEVTK